MTLDTYRTTYAWKSSLDLAPHLVRLAEQLPESEAAGLAGLLRGLSADVPGAIATDLVTLSHTALPIMLRTIGALEVIERVYPALDTATVRAAADDLATRIAGDAFTEAVPGPVAPVDPGAEPAPAAEPTVTVPVIEPAPVSAPVITVPLAAPDIAADPAAAPLASPAPAAVPIYAPPVNEVPSVQPNSPQ